MIRVRTLLATLLLAVDAPLDYNTESRPERIKPVVSEETSTKHVFPASSFTVMEVPITP